MRTFCIPKRRAANNAFSFSLLTLPSEIVRYTLTMALKDDVTITACMMVCQVFREEARKKYNQKMLTEYLIFELHRVSSSISKYDSTYDFRTPTIMHWFANFAPKQWNAHLSSQFVRVDLRVGGYVRFTQEAIQILHQLTLLYAYDLHFCDNWPRHRLVHYFPKLPQLDLKKSQHFKNIYVNNRYPIAYADMDEDDSDDSNYEPSEIGDGDDEDTDEDLNTTDDRTDDTKDDTKDDTTDDIFTADDIYNLYRIAQS